jgi:Rne/Rng family ribonuclease
MSGVLVINAAGRETRVALVENGSISEFYLERKKDRGIVGNVYKGRVTRVLPGMQAAFVDIGEDKAAFLYVGDVLFDPDLTRHEFELTEGEHSEHDDVPDEHAPDTVAEAAGETEKSETPADEELTSAQGAGQDITPSGEHGADAAEPGGVLETIEPLPSVPTVAEVVRAEAVAPSPPTDTADSAVPLLPPPLPAQTGETAIAAEPPAPPHEAFVPTGAEVLDAAAAHIAELSPETIVDVPPLEAQRSKAPRELRFKGQKQHHSEPRRERKPEPKKLARIEDLLKVGQEVLVQISKDPIGTKGARITSHISIPGRHLVFMPTVDHVGISRRISNEKERRRLRETVDRMRPQGTGFIVRTVAENVPQDKLEADIRFLIEVWNETVRKAATIHKAGLLHADLDLILRATRDLFARDVEKLVIDDADEYARVLTFVGAQDQSLKERVVFHDSEEPIFDAYGIEEEVKRATARKVWLKSGGYLIIDQAEALTAIDVNSGRYVGKKNLEDTILKINTEAAKEIVYQLRLRNIGGIIICDFIDMEKQQNRDRVFKTLQEAMGRDKAKTNVLRISELGLVEMTRKRVRESIGRTLHEDCIYCAGQGYVKSAVTVAYEIFRELRRSAGGYKDPSLVIQCQSEVANVVHEIEREELRHLMDRFNKSIQVRARPDYHREQFDIYARPVSGVEIKVAGNSEDFGDKTYSSAKKPGSNEAKFERERGERPVQDRNDRGERPGRGDRNQRRDGRQRNGQNQPRRDQNRNGDAKQAGGRGPNLNQQPSGQTGGEVRAPAAVPPSAPRAVEKTEASEVAPSEGAP